MSGKRAAVSRRNVVLLFAVVGAFVLVAVALQSGEAAPAVASILLEEISASFQLLARPSDLQRLASHEMEEQGKALAEENEKRASLTETGKQGASKMSIKKNSSGKRFMAYVHGSINRINSLDREKLPMTLSKR
jgi:hypothetical protein